MAAEAARVLNYNDYNYGSAAPARKPVEQPESKPAEIPRVREQARQRERARAAAQARNTPGISLFAVVGALFVSVLMFFVVLAQINYSEISSETVRLNAQLDELTDRNRTLEIAFENTICMKEIEQYARDVRGMSNPDPDQIIIINSLSQDRAEVLDSEEETGALDGFGDFISTLLDYVRR